MWDASLATFDDACWWREDDPSQHRAFITEVGRAVEVGASSGRQLACVADPIDVSAEPRFEMLSPEDRVRLGQAAEGHALLEGVARPSGGERLAHRSFLDALARCFEPYSTEQSV